MVHSLPASLRSTRRVAGMGAMVLAVLSSLIALGPRDVTVPTAIIFFGVPWLIRLFLIAMAWILVRPPSLKWKVIYGCVALHSLIQANQSFHWQNKENSPAGGFDVTLWNAGRNLSKMPRAWPELAGPSTKLVVLIEAGVFPPAAWEAFTAACPGFTWKKLDGGIVIGVKGRVIEATALGDRSRFRCHRLRVEIDDTEYGVVAVDIPSQPWLPRDPYLNRILEIAAKEKCLILGDFNTPPSARGFDRWNPQFHIANHAKLNGGFRETWCYGLPLLTLDQLWLSSDLRVTGIEQTATLHSDHMRMNFHVSRKRLDEHP